MTTVKKRRHHYVPSGLSRNFCLEPKKLYLYDTKNVEIRAASPKDVFCIKNLHSIVTSDGTVDHNMIEDELMHCESDGCQALNKIKSNQTLTVDDKRDIASFWALQILRTPFIRGGVEKSLKETLKATAKVLDKQGEFGETPDSLKKYGNTMSDLLDNGTVDINIILPQVTMMSLVAWPDATELLQRMNWCVLESSSNNYFLLSDNPCTMLDPDFDKHNNGVGIANKNIEISLPVSKNHCLIASWNEIPQYLNATPQIITSVNKRTALFGERFFVYPTQTKKILNLLNSYADVLPKMDVQSIPVDNGYYTIPRQNIFNETIPKALYKGLPLIFPEHTRTVS